MCVVYAMCVMKVTIVMVRAIYARALEAAGR